MKLQPKDFMIGDWVLVDGNPEQLTGVDREYIHLEGNCSTILLEGEVEPIPLTPEILEKNGFIKAQMISDTPPYDKDEEGNMHFSLNEKFWGWWQPNNTFLIPANGLGWLEFKYVHELQHALKLCKIEKEIVL